MNNILWYKSQAQVWTQALPIGNGSIGAMIFGGVKNEKLSMNLDTLWSGKRKDKDLDTAYDAYLKAKEFTLNGEYEKAENIIERDMLSEYSEAYMPLGDINIEFSVSSECENYSRSLDMGQAVADVEFNSQGNNVKREYFVSYPDDVMMMKFTSTKKTDFKLSLESQLKSSTEARGDILVLKGICPSVAMPVYYKCENPIVYDEENEGISFVSGVKILETDGDIKVDEVSIEVKNATCTVLAFAAKSNFEKFDLPLNNEKLNETFEVLSNLKDYDSVKKSHLSDYQELYNRAEINLFAEEKNIDTYSRLVEFQTDKSDLGMYVTLFNFGRYLTIASSREGTQATNLQGIWNKELRAPWSSNYTININAEMNYWPTLVCNLSQCYEPMLKMVEEISVAGQNTAKVQFNARGFTAHHNVDMWRSTTSVGLDVKGSVRFGFWPLGGGWLCNNLYEYYNFTQDNEFLRDKVYGILKLCSQFYLDVLTLHDGEYIFAPSTSPENGYRHEGKVFTISETTTMTTTIIKEVFINFLECCEILEIDDDEIENVKEKLAKMPDFKIGSKGQLLEWYTEKEEAEPTHRHISHLYGLHPANLITVRKTPDIAQAVKRSLELRGDDGTGWSLGWKINQWARLKDGNHAINLMNNQLRLVEDGQNTKMHGGGTYPNLFDAHPPFQIDGNFAFSAGLAELLIQSHEGVIEILPALPDCFKKGEVKGLVARGNIIVDFAWENGKVTSFKLNSKEKKKVIVCYNGKEEIMEIG